MARHRSSSGEVDTVSIAEFPQSYVGQRVTNPNPAAFFFCQTIPAIMLFFESA